MSEQNHLTESEPLDDVDRLLSRLERHTAPEDLTARVLASTVAPADATRAVFAWPWIVAGLCALALLVLAGYQLGASLAATDGLDIVEAISGDLGLLATAPGDVVAALGEVIPWGLVGVAGLSALLLVLAAGNIVSRGPASLRPGERPTA
jgi:hypothetical protein